MVSNPIHEVVSDQFRALFMLDADDDAASVENIDTEVILPDGTRWSATFMSIHEIERIMERWRNSGENAGGEFFHCNDLVVVRATGIPAMARALEYALGNSDPYSILTPLHDSATD
jgi:hypothetical protein